MRLEGRAKLAFLLSGTALKAMILFCLHKTSTHGRDGAAVLGVLALIFVMVVLAVASRVAAVEPILVVAKMHQHREVL